MRHDVAHHPAGRLGSHGNGLRALLITVEAAGIAASGGQNGVTGDDLGDGRKERNHLLDLSAEFQVVVRLWHQEPTVYQFSLRRDIGGLVGRQQHQRARQGIIEQQPVCLGLLQHVGHQSVLLTVGPLLQTYHLLKR